MKRVEIFLFIDALGWKIAEEHRFLEKELPERRKLEMQFGYSCTAIPTLLSGEKPSVHGHLGLFRFDPEHSFPQTRPARAALQTGFLLEPRAHPSLALQSGEIPLRIHRIFPAIPHAH